MNVNLYWSTYTTHVSSLFNHLLASWTWKCVSLVCFGFSSVWFFNRVTVQMYDIRWRKWCIELVYVVKRWNVYKTSPRPRSKYSLCSSYVDCFFLVGFALHQEFSNKSDECVTFCFSTTWVVYSPLLFCPQALRQELLRLTWWTLLHYVVGCCSFLTCLFAEAIKEMSNPPSSQWTYQSFTLRLLTTTYPF